MTIKAVRVGGVTGLAASAAVFGIRRRDPRNPRRLLPTHHRLRTLEQYAVDGVPRFDAATRHLVHQDGALLASMIRSAKAPVARAVHPCNYTTVAAILIRFLLAWAHSEPSDFTAAMGSNASTRQMPLWRRLVGWIWSAVLLAAAAVGLPLLPIYNDNHAAAAGLRYALLTAAVLALAAQGSPPRTSSKAPLRKHSRREPANPVCLEGRATGLYPHDTSYPRAYLSDTQARRPCQGSSGFNIALYMLGRTIERW